MAVSLNILNFMKNRMFVGQPNMLQICIKRKKEKTSLISKLICFQVLAQMESSF